MNALLEQLRTELGNCVELMESGTCYSEINKEKEVLQSKIIELSKENSQLKERLWNLEAQEPIESSIQPSPSHFSTFSVKVVDGTTLAASDATAKNTNEKNFSNIDSKINFAANRKASWQSYKEVLLLLQRTRRER